MNHPTRFSRAVAAIDLGAESGRVAVVTFDGARLDLTERHRFTHTPHEADGILRWDFDRIRAEVTAGLRAVDAAGQRVEAVGVDTWGVDYGYVSPDGGFVDTPTCYRDPRNVAALHAVVEEVGAQRLYDATGVQIIPINTVFSVASDLRDHPDRVRRADRLLMFGDLLHHELSGSMVTEYTAASTSALLDMRSGAWSADLCARLGIPDGLLPEVAPPGTDVGALVGGWPGALAGARVVLPPVHDTASAVVGTPFAQPHELFISSGTWSLVGVESPHAVITAASRAANLTNEGGYGGTIRLLRNVMGLWLLQACRRQWRAEGHDLDYADIATLAAAEPGLRSIVYPDDERFLGHGDLPGRIREYCRRTGQPVPQSIGAVARCVIDSLALGYRATCEAITRVTGRRPGAVVVTGGGSRHRLLQQLTADAVGLPVRCGPVEATALGNGATQLVALGELSGLADIRRAVAASTEVVGYEPTTDRQRWDDAAGLFARLERDALARVGIGGDASVQPPRQPAGTTG